MSIDTYVPMWYLTHTLLPVRLLCTSCGQYTLTIPAPPSPLCSVPSSLLMPAIPFFFVAVPHPPRTRSASTSPATKQRKTVDNATKNSKALPSFYAPKCQVWMEWMKGKKATD